jgi:DNA polymerase-3 subunit gamma/tau
MEAVLEDLAGLLHRVALAQAGAIGADSEPDTARVQAMASRVDAGRVQVMYQVAVLGRRDLPLAPDEYAGFTMTLLRMLSFNGAGEATTRRAEPAVASAPAAKPAATAPRAVPAQTRFDGNWAGLIERMNLTGMAGMAARNAELTSFANNHLELVVPESHRMYAEKAYVDKLKSEIAPYFDANLRLTIRVGTISGNTVAAALSREMEKKQASATEAIEEDPFVRDLVRDLGAEVVPSSIRPLDEAAGKSTNGKR